MDGGAQGLVRTAGKVPKPGNRLSPTFHTEAKGPPRPQVLMQLADPRPGLLTKAAASGPSPLMRRPPGLPLNREVT